MRPPGALWPPCAQRSVGNSRQESFLACSPCTLAAVRITLTKMSSQCDCRFTDRIYNSATSSSEHNMSVAYSRPRPRRLSARLSVELLEARNVPSVYSPAQIRHAYGIDQIAFNGVKGDGAGQTIAVVDAYYDSSIQNDLSAFSQRFGLP